MKSSDGSLLGLILGEEEKCTAPGRLPEDMTVAMAYVPYQPWKEPYEDEVGLTRGTVFACLDKPFIGEEAVKYGDA